MRKWFDRQEGAKSPTYAGWHISAHNRRLQFCVAAEQVVDLFPAVVICTVHSHTFVSDTLIIDGGQ
jgi:hypothetical protein